MKIKAKVLVDSVNPVLGTRLITMELTYPRYIHAEFMTHRVFSRNASSSRAIPIGKLIEKVSQNPVFPLEWGSNKPGMQAGDPISRMAQTHAEGEWDLALQDTLKHARKLKDMGVHKQIVNRLLEPFAYITVIVTATEWQNFFDLRISPLAQPEIRLLAEMMAEAQNASTPVSQNVHLPYITEEDGKGVIPTRALMMISAARCARVSYLNHDGLAPDIDKDLALAARLREDKHASVFEHQALYSRAPVYSRNFRDWIQHREVLGL